MSMQSPLPNNTSIHIFVIILILDTWTIENWFQHSQLYKASICVVQSTITSANVP